jgi:hypothetical protein
MSSLEALAAAIETRDSHTVQSLIQVAQWTPARACRVTSRRPLLGAQRGDDCRNARASECAHRRRRRQRLHSLPCGRLESPRRPVGVAARARAQSRSLDLALRFSTGARVALMLMDAGASLERVDRADLCHFAASSTTAIRCLIAASLCVELRDTTRGTPLHTCVLSGDAAVSSMCAASTSTRATALATRRFTLSRVAPRPVRFIGCSAPALM